MYYFTTYPSPVGIITLSCDGNGKNLVGLWIEGQKYHGGSMPQTMEQNDDISLFDTVKKWLDNYFAGKNPDASCLPLAPAGSDFRTAVWDVLRQIPYGEVVSYGFVAVKAAEITGNKTSSARAAGGAVGHNPISIIIPCHRVIGKGGSLTGYAGGIQKKIELLKLEGVDLSRLSMPKKGTAL